MSSKFKYESMGPAPIASTSNMGNLPANKIINEATTHIRKHSATGIKPALNEPLVVLQRNPSLATAAIQLSTAYFNAHTGGVSPPTVTAINNAIPQLAESIGLNTTQPNTPKQSPVFGQSIAKTPR